MSAALTERQIQDALWNNLRLKGQEWMTPCFTPFGWWECDMFSLTKSGLMQEYEIKLTLQDFKADAKKTQEFNRRLERCSGGEWKWVTDEKNKHAQLALGDQNGPSRFHYVVPEGLIVESDLPDWAGLIYVEKVSMDAHGLPHRLCFNTIRAAPKLHGQRVSEVVQTQLAKVFYYRFWDLRQKTTPKSS